VAVSRHFRSTTPRIAECPVQGYFRNSPPPVQLAAPQRVQMDVARQFQQIRVLLADDGLVPIQENPPTL